MFLKKYESSENSIGLILSDAIDKDNANVMDSYLILIETLNLMDSSDISDTTIFDFEKNKN